MAKKRNLVMGLTAVLAVILAAALLLKPDPAPAPGPASPVIQPQTRPTRPEQTETVTLPTEPLQTEPAQTTVPVQTEPVQTEPVETPPAGTQPPETEPEQTEPPRPEPVQTEPQVRELFPVLLEDGMLTVQSVFQFTGMNPDAEMQFGENIAGVQLVNTSQLHMTEAEIEAVLLDGTILAFRAEDVAPGMSVMAFSPEHAALADPALCTEVSGWAEFEEGDPLCSDLVRITVEGVAVTVTNVSGRDLTDLEISCHGLLDGSCFGGRTYTYPIATLPGGGSTTILAQDCILGMTQVARVELGE